MTNEVIWTKLVLERFIQLANLTEEEEIVIRTRAGHMHRLQLCEDTGRTTNCRATESP